MVRRSATFQTRRRGRAFRLRLAAAATLLLCLLIVPLALTPPAQALDPARIARLVDPSIVRITLSKGNLTAGGTGFVVSPGGFVATNYHVVRRHLERDWEIAVASDGLTIGDGIEIVAGYPGEDLAILRVPGLPQRPVRFARFDDGGFAKGATVHLLGFPIAADRLGPVGEASFVSGTVSRSFLGAWEKDSPNIAILQHTAPTNPGNSGGPLIDACGEVIGVNSQREIRVILGPGGIPLVSDPIQGLFFSSQATVLTTKLDELGLPYEQAAGPCIPATARQGDGISLALAALALVISLLALTLLALRHRPLPRPQ